MADYIETCREEQDKASKNATNIDNEDSNMCPRNALCVILNSLTQFSSKLNLGADVLKIDADPSKLQSLSTLQPEDLYSSLQQHILDLQSVSEKLKFMVKDNTGTTSQVKSAPEKTDGTSGKLNTDKGLADNSQLNGRIKAGQEESKHHIDDRIVQIKAGNSEIGRRIAAFIERKQGEINENNVREFCNVINCNQENSCARTDAVFTPYPGFRSHVKVTRVINTYGPQTRPDRGGEPCVKPSSVPIDCGSPAIEERLQNIEAHLKLTTGGPVPLNIYQRLKILEDRILELEGLSPEYFQSDSFLHKRQKAQPSQTYTLTELDGKINALKATLLKKVNECLPMETDELPL
ncbi:MAP3K12-binding inhibitory protein 1-like [Acipenser oxyrinchus oxyrinchus]|uniref:MAP3K12-binding inhibitory protein 1-like n=1 Tax=Acipenser oxyrinchus oxyrinchus TaxID=40147 RepID=A0AAD8FZJ5_ACIOX|nr:MAP3K12-binding inhibitory protein 1-like [Acipenser oxyrinchus oxyrinchus]